MIQYNGIARGLDRAVTDRAFRSLRKSLDSRGYEFTIFDMFELAHSRRGIRVAALSATIFVGCAGIPTWPNQASYGGDDKATISAGKSQEFDSKAACAEVIKVHNRIRAEAKLPPLEPSSKLQAAAERHAKDMAAQGKMSHTGSDGSSALHRITAKGYKYRRAGENIAAGHFTVDALMKGWMDSPHHKRNILGSFSQIGVACATGENGKRYWCVTFGLPARR